MHPKRGLHPVFVIYRNVSGTYCSPQPAGFGTILELRVDVDGRPQARVSGDYFTHIRSLDLVYPAARHLWSTP
jgi:hypothetical protein